jgi:predicted Zn-dependent protease
MNGAIRVRPAILRRGIESAVDMRTPGVHSCCRASVTTYLLLLVMARRGTPHHRREALNRDGNGTVQLGRIQRCGLAVALAAGVTLQSLAVEARSVPLVRDAEIEATLRRFTAPIFEAAGIEPDSVHIYVVNDSQLNAFVAGGMNLFLNTGLIMASQEPSQLVGVIAHETGHIAGGHLTRIGPAQHRATAEAILAAVLGAATAVVGAPGLGTAIIAGGQNYAQSGLMRFSRGQEQAADQAALTFLDRAGISARGLAEFFHILENQNVLAVSGVSPWLQSHPLTQDRIRFVEAHAATHPIQALPAGWSEAHARMVAKLKAFLNDPRQVLSEYKDDPSLPGRYARAIAHYRLPDLDTALQEIDALIAEHPDDPYFHELKGQMLFENGRIEDAIPPYRDAVRLAPASALLQIGLARALIETEKPADSGEAIGHLKEALQREGDNAFAWRLLGVAQGRTGQQGLADLAFAEYALRVGKPDDARLYAKRAENKIDPSDPAWLRLQDLLREIDEG